MPTDVIGDNTGDDYSGTEDTRITDSAATTNYGTADLELNKYAASDWSHMLLSFSGISSLPSSISVSSSSITLTCNNGTTNDDTCTWYRLLRNWVEAEATWNIYSTGNNWGTAGGTGSGDRSATTTATGGIGTDQWGSPSWSGSQLDTDIENMASGSVSNHGWHGERTDASNDSHWRRFFSSDTGAASGERPYLTVTYTAGVTVSPGNASLSFTGQVPTITASGDVTVSPGRANLNLTGQAPVILTPNTIQIPVGTLSLSGQVPTIVNPQSVSPANATLSLSGFSPTVLAGVTAAPGVGSLALTGYAATIINPHTIEIPNASLSFTGYAPNVGNPQTIEIPVGSLTLTGQTPIVDITLNQLVSVPVGSLALTGYEPTPQSTEHQYINVPVGALTFTTQAPVIVGTSQIGFLQATLTISPRLSGSVTVEERLKGALEVTPRLDAGVTIN